MTRKNDNKHPRTTATVVLTGLALAALSAAPALADRIDTTMEETGDCSAIADASDVWTAKTTAFCAVDAALELTEDPLGLPQQAIDRAVEALHEAEAAAQRAIDDTVASTRRVVDDEYGDAHDLGADEVALLDDYLEHKRHLLPTVAGVVSTADGVLDEVDEQVGHVVDDVEDLYGFVADKADEKVDEVTDEVDERAPDLPEGETDEEAFARDTIERATGIDTREQDWLTSTIDDATGL